jgi:putative DNA primase/helicase
MTAEETFEAMESGTIPPVPESVPETVAPEAIKEADEGPAQVVAREVDRLAKLSTVEYDLARKGDAKRLGISVSTLDAEVKRARATEEDSAGKSMEYPTVEPWAQAVDGAALFSEIRDTVRRFIVCEPETAQAVALWCTFTWFVDVVQVAPLAIITAPEKRCGKSQLLDLIGHLSCRPLKASNCTASVLFRVIERDRPTLLIDEADSFLNRSEDLRGIINSGHTRQSAFVLRSVGEDFEPKSFSTWGAKAISGIGKLAGTIMDRGIILELRRRLPTESVERLRHASPDLFPRLASMLARWSEDYSEVVRAARPNLPEALNDREQDSWEPLLAIADSAGGDWPEIARKAALKLSERNAENTVSTGAELLADIRDIFEAKDVDRLSSKDLLEALTNDEEKSWRTYNRGAPMSPKQLAKRLGGYEIHSGTIRTWAGTPKGYMREWFADAFARYLESKETAA